MGKESRGRRKADKAKRKAEKLERDHAADETLDSERDGATNSSVFFGLVDKTELEYFNQAESTLAANAFGNAEERQGFITGVFEEMKGKELKLATNQICSKLVERLILGASDAQLAQLLKKFNGHFSQLARHKYSSHCVETLVLTGAAAIEREILAGSNTAPAQEENMDIDEEPYASLENLFVFMTNELKADVSKLISDPYGSHVMRVLLLVLSGSELPGATSDNILRSRKSKSARRMIDIRGEEERKQYQVPSTFKQVLQELVDAVIDGSMGDDSTRARKMAVDTVTSPLIQVLMKVEGKARRVQRLIFAGDESEGSLMEHLLSDPVGSHFLEGAIQTVPTKVAERLYQSYMKGRLVKLAKRESGNFAVQAMLRRLRTAQVREMLDELVPEFSSLLESDNLAMVRAVCDCASSAHSTHVADLAKAIISHFASNNGEIMSEGSAFVEGTLKLAGSTLGQGPQGDWPTAAEMQRSLLLQSFVKMSPLLLETATQGFIDFDETKLNNVARHSIFSHALEKCLEPSVSVARRRQLGHKLTALCSELAVNAYGSHVVDTLWRYTYRIKFLREQVATSLTKNETTIKNSPYGKIVWKNWQLEKYVRRRHEWWAAVKALEDEISSQLGTSHDAIAAKQQRKPAPESTSIQHTTTGGPGKFKRRPKTATKPYDKPHRPAKAAAN